MDSQEQNSEGSDKVHDVEFLGQMQLVFMPVADWFSVLIVLEYSSKAFGLRYCLAIFLLLT